MRPHISLITPVFNGEAYLQRCLESVVFAAREHSVELIVIDDGSSDGSSAIAHAFSERYDWIRYCRQVNQGPSAARNTGLDMAAGEYIGFVDCDDCVAPSYVSALTEVTVTRPDIVVFGYERRLGNGNSLTHAPAPRRHFNEETKLLTQVSQDRELFWFACTKLFRADVIRRIHFDEQIRLGEDTIFNLQAVANSLNIVRIPDVLYFYYETPGSLSGATYKTNLLENMDRHFCARLGVHGGCEAELDPAIRKDMANYYLGHIVPWLVSNGMRLEKDAQLAELAKIRASRLVSTCLAWGESISVPRGVAAMLVMLRFRMLGLLRAVWSLKPTVRDEAQSGGVT